MIDAFSNFNSIKVASDANAMVAGGYDVRSSNARLRASGIYLHIYIYIHNTDRMRSSMYAGFVPGPEYL